MLSIGLDWHKQYTDVNVRNEHGEVIRRLRVKGPPMTVAPVLEKLQAPFQVCLEASCGYGPLHDALAAVAQRVVVAHPGQLRLIYRCKRKNDRVDAAKLSQLLHLDQVPAVHVPTEAVRSWRELIEFRRREVDRRTRTKNQLQGLLRGSGIATPHRAALWTRRGVQWIQSIELPTASKRLRRTILLEELARSAATLARIEQELARLAQAQPGSALLQTVPGVGPRTAEAFLAYVDDPHRFGSSKSIGAYLGLVPSQDSSGGRDRLGHITKDGLATLRKLLVEAAWQGIRRSPTLRAFFQRVQKGDRDRRKIALVATAHSLARCLLAMLKTGEAWHEQAVHPKEVPMQSIR